MFRQSLRVVYAVACAAMGAACLWSAAQIWEAFQRVALSRVIFFIVACTFFLLTGLAVVRGWRIGSWLAGSSGIILVLYSIAVVLMGWEDVGGARGAIPLALGTGLFGALGFAIGIGKRSGGGEAA